MRVCSLKRKGISLVEVVVGVAIVTGIISFVAYALSAYVNSAKDIADKTQALYFAEEGIELVRFIRDDDWNAFSNLTDDTTYYLGIDATTITVTTTPEKIGKFTRSFSVSSVERDGSDSIVTVGATDTETKYVTALVEWGAPTTSVSLQAVLANLNNP